MTDQQQMGGRASSRAAEEPQVTGHAERIVYPANPRLERIRFLANLLDTCIVLPGGYRIGIDPILGLIPGVGDISGAVLSLYLVREASKLGIRKWILVKMVGNIALEALLGTVPVIGDAFDAVWKANVRNLRLIELHYSPGRNAG